MMERLVYAVVEAHGFHVWLFAGLAVLDFGFWFSAICLVKKRQGEIDVTSVTDSMAVGPHDHH